MSVENNIITVDTIEAYDGVYKSKGSYGDIGRNFVNTMYGQNVSVKSEYTRQDYDFYRAYERSIRNNYENIQLCLRAYDKVGIVRNVIELMSDFVCKGIKLIHPVASQERFYQEWFQYVDGVSVSERFVNYLYRIANVPVSINYGQVPVRIETKWSRVNADKHPNDMEINEPKVEKRRVPLRYTFINPMNIEVLTPDVAVFTGKPQYAIRVSPGLVNSIKNNNTMFIGGSDDEYANYIPAFIMEALNKGQTLIPINNQDIRIYHYKKDDWKVWADSIIVPIMDDLLVLDKMKLADVSALDGAISSVRLWNVGYIGNSLANSILPTKEIVNKLRAILANGVGGGTLDLVWGPELKFTETNTAVHQFLGKAKYEPTLASIYEGLGVPFVSDSAGKGMSNNFIQMQTFVERLQYGRNILESFWNTEIKKIQKAMGYKKPALVSFDQVNLGDDSVYKQALLGLLDRDVISVDSLLDNFGFFSKIERIKIAKEHKMRDNKKMPPKAGAFHNPQSENDIKKLFVQQGGIAPSEIGIDLKPKKDSEESPMDKAHKNQLEITDKNNQAKIAQQKFKPKPPNGRPTGKKDSSKRKQKSIPLKTKGFVNTFLWGCNAQERISNTLTPILLENLYKKPNVRSLTTEETNKLEATKLLVFSNISPHIEVTDDIIKDTINKYKNINPEVSYAIKGLILAFTEKNGRSPNTSEIRQIQASGYALVHEQENSEIQQVEEN